MRRRFVPVAVSAALSAGLVIAGLTGCSVTGGAGADCVDLLQPGALSDHVAVSADSSAITVTGPTDISSAQRTVLTAGDADGAVAVPGGIVTASVSIFDAATGALATQRESAPYMVLPNHLLSDVTEALQSEQSDGLSVDILIATALMCARPGDRLVVAATPAQSMASQIGMSASVVVIDVQGVSADRAEGALRGLPAGFPAVATDDSGRPGVVLPPQAAPATLQVAPRILGTGPEVDAESVVIGHDLTVDWNSRTSVSNTWENGMTSFGTVADPNPAYDFRPLLNGYPAGTQLVILAPGDGKPVIHVVDIVSAS